MRACVRGCVGAWVRARARALRVSGGGEGGEGGRGRRGGGGGVTEEDSFDALGKPGE